MNTTDPSTRAEAIKALAASYSHAQIARAAQLASGLAIVTEAHDDSDAILGLLIAAAQRLDRNTVEPSGRMWTVLTTVAAMASGLEATDIQPPPPRRVESIDDIGAVWLHKDPRDRFIQGTRWVTVREVPVGSKPSGMRAVCIGGVTADSEVELGDERTITPAGLERNHQRVRVLPTDEAVRAIRALCHETIDELVGFDLNIKVLPNGFTIIVYGMPNLDTDELHRELTDLCHPWARIAKVVSADAQPKPEQPQPDPKLEGGEFPVGSYWVAQPSWGHGAGNVARLQGIQGNMAAVIEHSPGEPPAEVSLALAAMRNHWERVPAIEARSRIADFQGASR